MTTSSLGDAASLSSLTIVPSADDDKATLGCAAYSPKLPDEALEDEVSLNVLCKSIRGTNHMTSVRRSIIETVNTKEISQLPNSKTYQ